MSCRDRRCRRWRERGSGSCRLSFSRSGGRNRRRGTRYDSFYDGNHISPALRGGFGASARDGFVVAVVQTVVVEGPLIFHKALGQIARPSHAKSAPTSEAHFKHLARYRWRAVVHRQATAWGGLGASNGRIKTLAGCSRIFTVCNDGISGAVE